MSLQAYSSHSEVRPVHESDLKFRRPSDQGLLWSVLMRTGFDFDFFASFPQMSFCLHSSLLMLTLSHLAHKCHSDAKCLLLRPHMQIDSSSRKKPLPEQSHSNLPESSHCQCCLILLSHYLFNLCPFKVYLKIFSSSSLMFCRYEEMLTCFHVCAG